MNVTRQSAGSESDAAPRAGRVARRRDRRKSEIVRTAIGILAANGYQGMNLEDVAERTDIAKATLYHYFRSKDELVAAVLDVLTDEVMTRLAHRAEQADATSATELLRTLVDEQVRILTETAPEVATVFSWPREWPSTVQKSMKEMRRRHDAVFRDVVERGVADGEFTCPDIDVAMQCLHGVLNQAAVWIRPGGEDAAAARTAVVACALRLFV
ncbi:TetR/AcrR family transcriptional regulator [Rhodococcus sp. SGAir0479]|uniref:TetR/AcrR family transcriptional regulator n=1 Tax=Rhodococcus sp. SGAir0479 TaxID=2567884 RepID=UPI0010CCCE5D|nr:TetR/AcrR family transcriptional regulator [Rhodococcus sp. SGAir0479]QCQ89878.1 TetR/AcrR family transcriptional regulator [Rhodococcus sp. SGAir0479]